MIKHLILRKYRKLNVDNKELVYEILKWEEAFPFTLSLLKCWIYAILYYFLLYILYNEFGNIKYFKELYYLFLFIPYVVLFRRVTKMANPFYPNKVEKFIHDFVRRVFITPKGKAFNRSDFKMIKTKNVQLYRTITSDYCDRKCHYYARELALFFPDSKLIYCSCTNPLNKDNVFAHAIIKRNGEIYDTNRRMSYKLEDYEKAFGLKIYKEWTYDEFSKPDFKDAVKQDFYKWCQQNDVKAYDLF